MNRTTFILRYNEDVYDRLKLQVDRKKEMMFIFDLIYCL